MLEEDLELFNRFLEENKNNSRDAIKVLYYNSNYHNRKQKMKLKKNKRKLMK
jgi:hypothetical protein